MNEELQVLMQRANAKTLKGLAQYAAKDENFAHDLKAYLLNYGWTCTPFGHVSFSYSDCDTLFHKHEK